MLTANGKTTAAMSRTSRQPASTLMLSLTTDNRPLPVEWTAFNLLPAKERREMLLSGYDLTVEMGIVKEKVGKKKNSLEREQEGQPWERSA
jgi:hypothetical protein